MNNINEATDGEMLLYFWRSKGDPRRYIKYSPEKFPTVEKALRKLDKAHNRVERVIRELDD